MGRGGRKENRGIGEERGGGEVVEEYFRPGNSPYPMALKPITGRKRGIVCGKDCSVCAC